MKRIGIAIPNYAFDKNDKLVRSTRKLSVSNKIALRKSKRVSVKRGPPDKIEAEPGADQRLAGMLKKVLNTPPEHRPGVKRKKTTKC
jgi:hypothetical protein